MRILHLNYSDSSGGAAIAAYNIYLAQKRMGLDVKFLCYEKKKEDDNVVQIRQNFISSKIHQYKKGIDRRIMKFFINDRHTSYSTGLFKLNLKNIISEINPDIINIHWINSSMISIKEFSSLKKYKIFWTLHDMWPFCATEHYSLNNYYETGYLKKNFFDINNFIFKKKIKYFPKNINIIAPSEWIKLTAQKSLIFKNSKFKKIHHAIDENKWVLNNKAKSKDLLGLSKYKNIILFGAERGISMRRKNFSFLEKVLKHLKFISYKDTCIAVFGGSKLEDTIKKNYTIKFFGQIENKETLNKLYSASDILAVPSIQEVFGLVAIESMLSGTPVVSFRKTGVEDVIKHMQNGYLANYLNKIDFAKGIEFFLKNKKKNINENMIRKMAISKFNFKKISEEYFNFYNNI